MAMINSLFAIFIFFKEFDGNLDQNTIVKHEITNPPIRARYIRFQPVSWKGNIAMRAEIYGCKGKVCIKPNGSNYTGAYSVFYM